jgi:Tfp pilus assembly protein PilZ
MAEKGELHVQLPVQIADRVDDDARKLEAVARGRERRAHPRLSLGLSAHCQIDGIVSQEALGDLSEGGLFLQTTAPVRIGSRVRIVLGLPYIGGQRVCSLAGHVVRLIEDGNAQTHGAGVQFDQETDTADRELLRGFLALWGTRRET